MIFIKPTLVVGSRQGINSSHETWLAMWLCWRMINIYWLWWNITLESKYFEVRFRACLSDQKTISFHSCCLRLTVLSSLFSSTYSSKTITRKTSTLQYFLLFYRINEWNHDHNDNHNDDDETHATRQDETWNVMEYKKFNEARRKELKSLCHYVVTFGFVWNKKQQEKICFTRSAKAGRYLGWFGNHETFSFVSKNSCATNLRCFRKVP